MKRGSIFAMPGCSGSMLRLKIVVTEDLLGRLKQIAKSRDSVRPARWISQIEEMREPIMANINRKASTDDLFPTMAATSALELPPKRRFLIK